MKLKIDGKELGVGKVDLNTLCAVEDKFGSLSKMGADIPMKAVRHIAFLVLAPHFPGCTEEQIGAKLDIDAIQQLAKCITPEPRTGADRPL